MGWTSYYVGNQPLKDCCLEKINQWIRTNEGLQMKKYCMKGNSFYALMNTKGEDWVLLLLTRKEDGNFYYKDIQCNPCESGDIPPSILKDFTPSNLEDLKWLDENIIMNNRKSLKEKEESYNSLWNCTAYQDIVWKDGKKITKGESFTVRIENISRNPKRKKKGILLYEKDGKQPVRYLVAPWYFNSCKKEKVL